MRVPAGEAVRNLLVVNSCLICLNPAVPRGLGVKEPQSRRWEMLAKVISSSAIDSGVSNSARTIWSRYGTSVLEKADFACFSGCLK